MGYVFQGGGEGFDQVVGQLGEEVDGVYVDDGYAGGQGVRVGRDIQRGEQLISGLDVGVIRQRFD